MRVHCVGAYEIGETMKTTIVDVLTTGGGMIRFTKICAHLRELGETELIAKTIEEIESAGRTCTTHGRLEDPVLMVDTNLMRLIVVCPWCSGPETLAQWESQEVKELPT